MDRTTSNLVLGEEDVGESCEFRIAKQELQATKTKKGRTHTF
jgi:hypothetical protein